MGKAKYSCPECFNLMIKQSDVFEFSSVGLSTKKKKRRLHICSKCSYQTFTPSHIGLPFHPHLVDDFVVLERLLDPAYVLDGSFCKLYDAYFERKNQLVTYKIMQPVM
jgi:hypothetical protein